MLQHDSKNPPPIKPKPTIAAKPAVIPKSNYVLVGGNSNVKAVLSKNAILGSSKQTTNSETSKDMPDEAKGAIKKNLNVNHISLPSSPNIGIICANDCCGILNNKLQHNVDCIHNGNGNGGTYDSHNEENNNNTNSLVSKKLKTPSDSFDSSLSSSSGGFKDPEFLTKTKIAYEMYDKEDDIMQQHIQLQKIQQQLDEVDEEQYNQQQMEQIQRPQPQKLKINHIEESLFHQSSSSSSSASTNHTSNGNNHISNSKILELQSKLIAQQQQQLQQQSQSSASIDHHIPLQKFKSLEQVLAQRIDKESHRIKPIVAAGASQMANNEKTAKRSSQSSFDESYGNSHHTSNCNSDAIESNLSKQIAQKLQEEMKKQCQMIKDKYLIETVPVQQHYSDYLVDNKKTFFICFSIEFFLSFCVCFFIYFSNFLF